MRAQRVTETLHRFIWGPANSADWEAIATIRVNTDRGEQESRPAQRDESEAPDGGISDHVPQWTQGSRQLSALNWKEIEILQSAAASHVPRALRGQFLEPPAQTFRVAAMTRARSREQHIHARAAQALLPRTPRLILWFSNRLKVTNRAACTASRKDAHRGAVARVSGELIRAVVEP